jgi:hypothetical protein
MVQTYAILCYYMITSPEIHNKSKEAASKHETASMTCIQAFIRKWKNQYTPVRVSHQSCLPQQ